MGPKGLRPRESQMPIRGVICAGCAPPMWKGRWGWELDWVWRIATVGEAEAAALDLAHQLEAYGLQWLSRDWELKDILALLEENEPSPILVWAPTRITSHVGLKASRQPASQCLHRHGETRVVWAKAAGLRHAASPILGVSFVRIAESERNASTAAPGTNGKLANRSTSV